MTKKSKSVAPRSRLNKNIDLPPISKSATGAAAGAVLGAVGGPVGAAVGGVVGAVVGKRAESEPLMPMVKRAARQTARGVKAAAKAGERQIHEIRREKVQGRENKFAIPKVKTVRHQSEKAFFRSEKPN
jgi:hypothetical protein